jgi:glucosyl-dolichyl phosphate glucuronosyltransferase
MTISVVIATYNRAPLLAECLEHLARQPFAAGDEVVVVDNACTDETPRVIEAARASFPVPLHHLDESAPGKSRAIARALDVAAGDVLAFTDDDVDVDEGWLDSLRAAMRNPDVALIGGPVAPRWEKAPPRWLRQATDTYGPLAAPLAVLDYGASTIDLGVRTVLGANMAVRRSVFTHVGGFAPHLGKLRGTLLSGEDRELCRQVQAAGFRAVYCPELSVRHWVPAERMRIGYYLAWFFWSGITHAALDTDHSATGRALLGVPLYLVRRAAVSAIRSVAAAMIGNLADAVERALDVAFAAGYATRSWQWRRSRAAMIVSGAQR